MKRILYRSLIGLICAWGLAAGAFAASNPFDGIFSNPSGWHVIGQAMELSLDPERALCVSYTLNDQQRFVVLAKEVKAILPENYKIEFQVKNLGPSNPLEFKLIDRQGNTFLKKWGSLNSSSSWRKMTVAKSDISFGWGPVPNAILQDVAKIEIAVSYGMESQGKIYLKDIKLIPLATASAAKMVKANASSEQEKTTGAQMAMDGNMNTRWSSVFSDKEWIEFDLGAPQQLLGVILHWEAAFGKEYEIKLSMDGNVWRRVYTTTEGKGGVEDIDFEKQSARYIKLVGIKRGTGWGYSFWEMTPKTIEEPYGIGMENPAYILKDNWNFKAQPVRSLYVPDTWNQGKSQLWLDGDFSDADLLVNNQIVTRITTSMKRPVKINLGKLLQVGQENKVSLQPVQTEGKTVVRTLFLLQTAETFDDVKQTLQLAAPLDYYKFMARVFPAGMFPSWMFNKQDYWTIVGADSGYTESLFSATGTVGVYANSFSITPFLFLGDRLITAADVKREVSLEKGYLPLPRVKWSYPGVEFSQTLFSGKVKNHDTNYLWYHVQNTGNAPWQGKLFLAFRPFEVNPPWQYGGLTKITSLNIQPDKQRVIVNEDKGLLALTPCSGFGGLTYNQGDIVEKLSDGQLPATKSLKDPTGLISGAMAYDLQLGPKEEKDFLFVIPLEGSIKGIPVMNKNAFFQAWADSKKYWEKRVENFDIRISEQKLIDVMRSNIAYILITKDGPVIQPGPRNYKNSWIRDGAIMAAALLRTGHFDSAREYIEWFSRAILPSGEVPYMLNARTATMPDFAKQWKEWDCQGEYVFCVADYYRFTKDKAFLEKNFPSVQKALGFLKELRGQMLQSEYKGTSAYGILPKSESHEGYIGNPQQSSWDDYWGLKGWKDGQELAAALGKKNLIADMKAEEMSFRKNFLQNMAMVEKKKKLDYIPASIGLGDFDPTATSISAFPTDEAKFLDRGKLLNTLNRYYSETLSPRLNKSLEYSYTPYEIRTANAYNLLGQKEKALTMLRYFLRDMRPNEWNHWGEVVHADPLAAAYVGDMPHTWIGGIYVNAVRNLFLYESEESLVLGSGVDSEWLKQGVSVKNMPSYFGTVNYSINEENGKVIAEISGDAKPGKGFFFCSPYLDRAIKKVTVNGKELGKTAANKVEFDHLPVKIVLEYE